MKLWLYKNGEGDWEVCKSKDEAISEANIGTEIFEAVLKSLGETKILLIKDGISES